jgi:molybdopterin-containing oxidoreductase family iron-sulfur binding subunit
MMKDPTENHEGKTTIDLAAIQAKLASGQGAQAWRSLGELAGTAEFQEFLHKEFPRETGWVKNLSRRGFLKLLAAPLALAGLSACLPQPQERILPYADQAPERIVPGRPLYFATAMEMDGYAQGLLVESHMGRPTKVEGNPLHPASLGATDAFAQASILCLYDPDRAQVVSSRGQIRTWDAFLEGFTRAIDAQRGGQGAGLRLLSGTITSPTLAAQARSLLEPCPQAVWYQYDPAGRDEVRAGAQMAFGEVVQTRYRFDRANVILSLDNNFASQEPGSLRYLREFAGRRQISAVQAAGQEGGGAAGSQIGEGTAELNRLYIIESTVTPLGAFADHRLPVQAVQVEGLARLLAEQLGVQVSSGAPALPEEYQVWIKTVAEDLQANQGQSLVLAGPQQPPVVHALVHAINAAWATPGKPCFTPIQSRPSRLTSWLGLRAGG